MAKSKLPDIVKSIKEYKHTPIDPEKSKTVSFSQFHIYSKCPHQWYLTYVKKLAPYTPSIHATFGTALHETVQNWLETLYNDSVKQSTEMDIESLLLERMKKNYNKEKYLNNSQHYSTPEQLFEFYEDGICIINSLKKERLVHFSTKDTYLVGIEIPLLFLMERNILFKGFIDIVLYDSFTNTFKIVDLKTSTRGWDDTIKKDDIKISQILLYKEFFSRQFNIDIDTIDVEYFIVKRKIPEVSEYPVKRLQVFKPASGKIKRGKAMEELYKFLHEAFTENGEYNVERTYEKKPSKSNCAFCPFKGSKYLCPESL